MSKPIGTDEMLDRIEQLAATNKELETQLAKAEKDLLASNTSREHFRYSSYRHKNRCHELRHRQRSLIRTLQKVKSCTSIADAVFVAHIGLGGWSDDELVFESRTTLKELKGQNDE